MLFTLTGVEWLDRVDWGHWRDSARELAPDHPTVARDYQPLATPRPGPLPPGGEGEETEGPSFAAIREAHGALLDRVAAAIRVRGLAIRTEQT